MSAKEIGIITVEEPDFTPENLEKWQNSPEPSIYDYNQIVFSDDVCRKLQLGVKSTLDANKLPVRVKVSGGKCYEAVKRAIDVVASFAGLLVLAVPLGLVILVIYLSDKGNPIFIQTRFTTEGKPFKMYKLRTMVPNAEELKAKLIEEQKKRGIDTVTFKLDDDPRITKIGKFLRKSSIDELPQLLNVLKGDMTIIGPRPAIPSEILKYEPRHMERMRVKAGLSCYHQCENRDSNDFEAWVESDLKYIGERNFFVDAKILCKTAVGVLFGKGAK